MARVLVVDDEQNVRSFIGEALELDGHQVDLASDGRQALERCTEEQFQVVLTDLKMPHLGGMDLLRELRRLDPPPQVIMLTAFGAISTAVEAMKLGALDYLQKPVGSLKALRALVERGAERYKLLNKEMDPVSLDRVASSASKGIQLSWGAKHMQPVLRAVARVADAPTSVLLLGESGVGKEVVARRIHQLSSRRNQAFMPINCAAIADSLLESELFGHEKGAFTGASERRTGLIEQADGGTVFLDEIGEMRFELQAKLLRVIEQQRFQRVGASSMVEVDVRWVAATNRDLRAMVDEGSFRADLYHRLAVFPIRIPPLRHRREDIAPLAQFLAHQVGQRFGRPDLTVSQSAREALSDRPWHGNVRELRNTIERAALMAGEDELTLEDFAAADLVAEGIHHRSEADVEPLHAQQTPTVLSLADAERQAIELALAACDGNRRETAEMLGIAVRTLYDKLKRYELG